ncbi:MAG: hypothetical protein L0Y72_22915 [Gemmataceae bacterium]|nr:hypothetical protein [Gemmataceae bacterium]MCI0741895.1 hypothetical protein [Gemmataceae bacterium]
MWTPHYREFVARRGLVGKCIAIPAADDVSGVGASIELLDEDSAAEEANEFYPGLVVKADGFVPIGSCLIGTGDPYFINVRDDPPGPVYRIYHDSVIDDKYDRQQAVACVLTSYELLLQFAGR